MSRLENLVYASELCHHVHDLSFILDDSHLKIDGAFPRPYVLRGDELVGKASTSLSRYTAMGY